MTIKTEDYPLARRLFLYTGNTPSPAAKMLLDHALEESAQPVVKKAHFVDLSVAREDESGQASSRSRIERYRDFYAQLDPAARRDLRFDDRTWRDLRDRTSGAERLSVTFYFEFGSEKLDTRAQQDVWRLAHYLNDEARGQDVLLAGFADAIGTFPANLTKSHGRADAVREELLRAGVARDRLEARGFSKLLPVVCNTPDTERRRSDPRFDQEVRQKNRRVEVWVRRAGAARPAWRLPASATALQ